MRYAIFSDIHGNLVAWNQVLQDIKALDADVLVCLGDVVGYGPLPEDVLNAIRAETDHFVIGNHDAAAVGLLDSSAFNDHARNVIEWTAQQLSPESHEFLANVPLSMETDEILFVHAEAAEPARFGYITDVIEATENFATTDHFVTFVGHTHDPTIFSLSNDGSVQQLPDDDCRLEEGQRYIVNVGSVGEPRNPEDLRARYVIYDEETREVFFRRIEFDPEAYRRDLNATTLNASPYFLQVIDQLISEALGESAMAIDMEAPAEETMLAFQNRKQSKRLVVPVDAGVTSKPKPQPKRKAMSKKTKGAIISFAALSCLILLVIGTVVWIFKNSGQTEVPILASSSTNYGGSQEIVVPLPEAEISAAADDAEIVVQPDAAEADDAVLAGGGGRAAMPEEPAAAVAAAAPAPKPEPPKAAPAPTNPKPKTTPDPKPKPTGREVMAKFVRVFLPKPGILSLAEVEVHSNGENIAPDGKATQSTTNGGAVAQRAIDANPNGIFTQGSVTHTNDGANPWWEADLGKTAPVEKIVVWNRTDCCQERIDGFQVHLLDANRNVVWESGTGTARPNPSIAITVPPTREIEIVAWWRMEPNSIEGELIDSKEQHNLAVTKAGSKISALAPDEIPLTKDLNSSAMSLGIWQEEKPSGAFQLSAQNSFTIEGWILTDRPRAPIFVAGTRSGKNGGDLGWHVDVRPASLDFPLGQMSFFYDNGPELDFALSEDVNVADLKPHHFAAVWDHDKSGKAGEMRLYLDSKQIAAHNIPHSKIAAEQVNPFRIGAPTNPDRIALDEIRFTADALKPREFLNLGQRVPEIILTHDFFGSDQQLLNEQPVSHSTIGSKKWVAHGEWTANGKKTVAGDFNAYFPFKPKPNRLYVLELDIEMAAGAGHWIAFGFTEKAPLTGNIIGAGPSAWALRRHQSGAHIQGYIGHPNQKKIQSLAKPRAEELKEKPATVAIHLDSRGGAWKSQWLVNGTPIGPPLEHPQPPKINHIGIGSVGGSIGRVSNLRLSSIEPQ